MPRSTTRANLKLERTARTGCGWYRPCRPGHKRWVILTSESSLMLARLRLIPQDDRFFDLFNRAAENTLEGARVLHDLLNNYADVDRKARHLKDIEHTGDEITHEVFGALHRTFVTPLDREDISNLASSLDDVIDWIEEVGRRIRLYRIDKPTPIACQFTK